MKNPDIISNSITNSGIEQITEMLEECRAKLDNYLEVLSSLDDDDYIARGNGFCESRYSTDFIEGQIEKFQQRISELENLLDEQPENI